VRERAIASTNMAATLRLGERERESHHRHTGTITWQHSNIRQKQWQKISPIEKQEELLTD
jgi:Spy/CpxP family protein refolding chaperone